MGGIANAGRSAAHMKEWRVYSALLSYFNTTCTLFQGMAPQYRIHSRMLQTMVGGFVNPWAGGANQALVLHLSNSSQDPAFRADVAAKESNQDRALGLLLMGIRFGLLLLVGSEPGLTAWVVVAALSLGHIVLNYMCARILVLRTLNQLRFSLVFDSWHAMKQEQAESGNSAATDTRALLSPTTIAAQESVLPMASCFSYCAGGHGESWAAAPLSLEVGVSVTSLLPGPTVNSALLQRLLAVNSQSDSKDSSDSSGSGQRAGYVLGGDPQRCKLCAVLLEGCDGIDVQFEALLHAAFVRKLLSHKARRAMKATEAATLTTEEQLVAAIEACRPRVVKEAPMLKAVLGHAGWRVSGKGWLQLNVQGWRLLQDGDENDGGDDKKKRQ